MKSSFAENESVESLVRAVKSGSRVISIDGLTSSSSKAFLLSTLREKTGKHFVVVTDSNTVADEWRTDLQFFDTEPNSVTVLPAFETSVYSGLSPHAETLELRALALWQLRRKKASYLVLPLRSLLMRLPSFEEFDKLSLELKMDDEISLDVLTATMDAAGYVNEEPIANFGQYSVRGGIVDIWSPASPLPVRIEFFGDTVDSIREFDPETQLSTGSVRQILIAPMREYSATGLDLQIWAEEAKAKFKDEPFARALKDRTDFADVGETFGGWEFLMPLSKPMTQSAFDLFGDAVLVVDEPTMIEDHARSIYEEWRTSYERTIEGGQIALEPSELLLKPDELREALENKNIIELRALGKTAAATDEEFSLSAKSEASILDPSAPDVFSKSTESTSLFLFPTAAKSSDFRFISRPSRRFGGRLPEFAEHLGSLETASDVKFILRTKGLAERLEEILREYQITHDNESIIVGDLTTGFEMPAAGIVYFSESDIFGETGEKAARRIDAKPRKSKLTAFVSDFRDLKPGDYVVHIDHGLGRFEGLQTISAQGTEREFMLLVYADNAKLFVPVERLDLVSRYSSGESTAPTLERLGGIGWQKTKAKAKRAMRDMADELLKLYAERKLVTGYSFSPDAPWQHEFEDAFPYELTVDQGKAIEDVKDDMEAPRPMDRLIIGDVGYGKTEVAMRAAFKAVMDGKQVAVLTPTTILAYQHFESFRKRFAAFPAKIDLLSRFRSSKEQKSVVAAAEKGDVDVVIGTHRVLSNDVKLPKLGLVIVDEEQRFGVAHKEKLKQLKKKVDVLTLSATPIPRTLNMSLLGMRDLSVIETPPRDRLAINTQVVQFSENVIRSAIDLELSRNGQVFFIHNRVETIEAIAALVQKIVPNARVAIGHGQMNEKEMEQVMLDFIDFKYDILVATTIIENGIDIPRANTIIINRADNYGLSQLYQLRGRVGRSNRRAYAYLLIPSEIELTPIARRRLSAIREFSDLGAGFRIAALDLELRGAGNILGGQQSGHLDALGFDLYTKMLERTIAELRGDEVTDEISVAINLGIDLAIPKDYIVEAGQRLRTYKRIASAESEAAISQIRLEIEDRYGRIPRSVDNLFEYGRLRNLAEQLGILSIESAGTGFAIKLGEQAKIDPEKLLRLVSNDKVFSFSANGVLRATDANGGLINSIRNTLGLITN